MPSAPKCTANNAGWNDKAVLEIVRIPEVLNTEVPDSECVFAVVLTRGDVRHMAQDWNLSDDELETVMQRLDDAFEHGADVSIVHDVVRELMEEKRASRQDSPGGDAGKSDGAGRQ